ncbi:MAG: hypothetical protein IIT45_00610, partial [Treponema sp.]|nr:hypothetical protein [Treponema sp.]
LLIRSGIKIAALAVEKVFLLAGKAWRKSKSCTVFPQGRMRKKLPVEKKRPLLFLNLLFACLALPFLFR